jgi:hypothetical protein
VFGLHKGFYIQTAHLLFSILKEHIMCQPERAFKYCFITNSYLFFWAQKRCRTRFESRIFEKDIRKNAKSGKR